MLHTDFVSNFCLFFEHAYRLDTRRQKNVRASAAANGWGQGSVRALRLFQIERGAERAPRSVINVHHPKRFLLT